MLTLLYLYNRFFLSFEASFQGMFKAALHENIIRKTNLNYRVLCSVLDNCIYEFGDI